MSLPLMTSAYIWPLLMLPLWGIARTWPPVFFSYAAMNSQSFSGSPLSKALKGRICFTRSGPSRKITHRCRLAPAGPEPSVPLLIVDHSYPLRAVKVPGSLYLEAMSTTSSQTERLTLGSSNRGMPETKSFCMETTAAQAFSLLPCMSAYHSLPTSVASKAGSASLRSLAMPRYSAWSVTTRKSSGRTSFTRWPLLEVTTSPRANRKLTSGPFLFPIKPLSTDNEVWWWQSPKSTRCGKC